MKEDVYERAELHRTLNKWIELNEGEEWKPMKGLEKGKRDLIRTAGTEDSSRMLGGS